MGSVEMVSRHDRKGFPGVMNNLFKSLDFRRNKNPIGTIGPAEEIPNINGVSGLRCTGLVVGKQKSLSLMSLRIRVIITSSLADKHCYFYRTPLPLPIARGKSKFEINCNRDLTAARALGRLLINRFHIHVL
jgi:hypothetical protein